METIYYVRDSNELSCATCAVDLLSHEVTDAHDRGEIDPALRLAAGIRLAKIRYGHRGVTVEDVHRVLPHYWLTRGRDRAALDLLSELVSDVSEQEHSASGEQCGGCDETLVEPWVNCTNCNEAGYYPRDFDAGGYPVEWDDGGYTEYCGRCCEDDTADAETLVEDDGRGYKLTYGRRPNYRNGAEPCYAAGCRRFSTEQALAHWGDPMHMAPDAAARLFGAVLRHAMRRALPRIVLADDREPAHVGHYSRFGGQWWCDTCDSPYCDQA